MAETFSAGRAVLVLGAGVSKATSREAPDWFELIASGAVFLRDLVPDGTIQPLLARLDEFEATSSDATNELLAFGDEIETYLRADRGGPVVRWLHSALAALAIDNPDLIQRLHNLGTPMLTTNYDLLISHVTGRRPVTWTNPAEFHLAVNNPMAVIHLHGYYDDPLSVVLGSQGYERIGGNAVVQSTLHALWTLKTLVFVGFGLGLQDPSFVRLFEWGRRVFGDTAIEHFVVTTNRQADAHLEAELATRYGLIPVGYGDRHEDLPGFVESLPPSLITLPPRNLPPRNGQFFDRPALMNALDNGFSEPRVSEASPAVVVAHGASGVGKSELLREYAHERAADYQLQWWISAAEPSAIAEALLELAQRLPLANASRWEVAKPALWEWFRRHEGWMLVFDNAIDLESLRPYLPSGSGHILVSTLNPNWGTYTSIPVEGFSSDDATEYLEARLGTGEAEQRRELAMQFGGYPLALAQAAGYIVDTGCTVEAYLRLYAAHPAATLAAGTTPGYPNSVRGTLGRSLDRARENCLTDPACSDFDDVVALCAFLHPDAIDIGLWIGACSQPAQTRNVQQERIIADRIVASLRSVELVKRSGNSLTFHRIAQEVIRAGLPRPEDGLRAAISALQIALPDPRDTERWSSFRELVAHVHSVARHARALGVGRLEASRLLNGVGEYQNQRGLFSEAGAALTEALELQRASHDATDVDRARTLMNRGVVEAAEGSLVDARGTLLDALAIQQANLDPDHPDIARSKSTLGNVQRELGDYPRAESNLRDALAIFGKRRQFRREVATALMNLGVLLIETQGMPDAAATLAAALQIQSAIPDLAGHQDIARTKGNLGIAQLALGQLDPAEDNLKAALATNQATLGPSHLEVAKNLGNLGSVYSMRGNLPKALRCLERSLSIKEDFYGATADNHVDVGITLASLGEIQCGIGDQAPALVSLQRALSIFRHELPATHPHIQRLQARIRAVRTQGCPSQAPGGES